MTDLKLVSSSVAEPVAAVPTFLTPKQLVVKHPCFSHGGVRAWLFNADANGLNASGAVLRIGRKILFDEVKFFEWVRSHQAGGKL